MHKLIFLSSPFSNSDKKIQDMNYKKIAKYAIKLSKEGKIAFSPLIYGLELKNHSEDFHSDWKSWQDFCTTMISKCDEFRVYRIAGWDKSEGVRGEIEYAKSIGIEVIYVDEELD